MRKKRRNSNQPTRRKPYREPRKRFLIVCGGSVTELGYFEGIREKYRDRLIKLDIVRGTRAPEAIVNQAVRLNDEENARATEDFDRFDEVWCVFDKDQFDLKSSVKISKENGISLAISNPCFELWLLLHFQDQTSHLTATQARRLCQKHLPGYEKSVKIDLIWPNTRQAMVRAQDLDQFHIRNSREGDNPSTGVYRLIYQIEQSQLRKWGNS